jgi:hypothetical protein
MSSYPLLLSDFNEIWIFSTDFEKYSNIKLIENPSSGRRVIPCSRTDIKKLIVAFHSFANVPKNMTGTCSWPFWSILSVNHSSSRHACKERNNTGLITAVCGIGTVRNLMNKSACVMPISIYGHAGTASGVRKLEVVCTLLYDIFSCMLSIP